MVQRIDDVFCCSLARVLAAGMSGDSNAVGAEVPEQESIEVAQSVAAKEEEVLLPKANVICIPAVRRLAKENNVSGKYD